MFSFVTVYTAMYLNLQSISFIGNREYTYTGANVDFPPGPFGYQHLIYNKAISFVPHIAFMLNTWLADGLLVGSSLHPVIQVSNVGPPALSLLCHLFHELLGYRLSVLDVPRFFRCVVGPIHQPTLSANVFDTAMGIVFTYYQISEPTTVLRSSVPQNFDYPFFAISPSLNILLTIMIVTRLVLHRRSIRNARGSSAGTTTGLYKAIVTILVESCALYAASFILFLGPWGSQSSVANIFFPVLAQAQVRAIFQSPRVPQSCLIIVANRLSHRSSSFNESPTREH